jgi:hypothetical protein
VEGEVSSRILKKGVIFKILYLAFVFIRKLFLRISFYKDLKKGEGN